MGRSIALTLAREGASVVVNYRSSEAKARAIADHINRRGGKAIPAKADVSTQEGCRHLIEAATAEFGKVDICVINPGAGWHPEPPEALDVEGALADARQELGPVYWLMAFTLPGMSQRKWGRIIAISLALTSDSPAYAYDVAKAARTAAVLRAKNRLWQMGATVNVIAPGPVGGIDTLDEAVALCDHGPAWKERANVTPQDIAEGVAFLCSDEAQFVSGCQLPFMWRQ
jgi:NAD(P)-dependent dehydrogenase (short-subunit alcohol dehydrogenase family)